jgi:hypothetical protein
MGLQTKCNQFYIKGAIKNIKILLLKKFHHNNNKQEDINDILKKFVVKMLKNKDKKPCNCGNRKCSPIELENKIKKVENCQCKKNY